jgi:hypothetical protein
MQAQGAQSVAGTTFQVAVVNRTAGSCELVCFLFILPTYGAFLGWLDDTAHSTP